MSTASNQSTRFFAAFLVASVFLHGVGIFAFWGLTQLFTPKPPPFSQTVIRTKLVKLGKKRENAAPAKPEATAQPKPESAKPPPKEPPKKEAVKVPDNRLSASTSVAVKNSSVQTVVLASNIAAPPTLAAKKTTSARPPTKASTFANPAFAKAQKRLVISSVVIPL